LYGHEGSANTVSFSPSGDFFTSSGADSVVMCWKSNLNEIDTEVIDDLGGKASNAPAKTVPIAAPITRQRPSSAKGAAV
jgi:WD40 repeat protein